MPPSESTAVPPEDPADRLVAELNHLRATTGTASFRKLAARTNYSRSALWRATRSSCLPSREITLALASACGGDTSEWDRKWRTARASLTRTPGQAAGADTASDHTAHRLSVRPRVVMVLLALAIVVIGTAAAPVTRRQAAPQPSTAASQPIDGDDPYVKKCGVDQQRLEYQNIQWPDHELYGWLELYHSHLCNTSWGYVFGPNSVRWQVTIVARRVPGNAVAPSSINADDPPNSWGNMLSTPVGTCVRVEAYLTVGAANGPIAATSCQPDRPGGGIKPPLTPAPPPPEQYAATKRT